MSQGYDESDWFTARQIAEVVIRYRVPGHRTSESGIIRWIKERRAGPYGWRFEKNTAQWYGEYRGATAYHWAAFLFDRALCSALAEEGKRRRVEAKVATQNAQGTSKVSTAERSRPVLDLNLAEGDFAQRLAAEAGVDRLPVLYIRVERVARFGAVSFGGRKLFCERLTEHHGEKVSLAGCGHLPHLLWVFIRQSRWSCRRYINSPDHYIGVADSRGGDAKFMAVRRRMRVK